MKIKSFLLKSKNIERDSYFWNMTGGLLTAFQSVIMLMILTRVMGLKEAGIFTIAVADANLFLTIGKYGMRNFQVSDVREQFSFEEYRASRIFTSMLMIIVSVGYVLYVGQRNGYTFEKSITIIWMCLLKFISAVEDVYHGLYQQKNRLDMAGKELTIRLGLTIMIFGVTLFILHNLSAAIIVATFVSFSLFLVFNKWMFVEFRDNSHGIDMKKVYLLLRLCFPLFVGSFLSFYIGNAPKYAIDAMLTDELQACYGFIAMPVFVISLLNGFVFNPILHKISILWSEKKIKKFNKTVFQQMGIIAIITLICLSGAYLLGIPVLSWLYNTDLTPYKTELLILLLGGGFLGLSGFLNTINTIIRQQRLLMWGYGIVSIMAYLFSNRVVEEYEMYGAAMLYMVLMAVLCVVFFLFLIYGIGSKQGMYKKNVQ